MTLLGFMPLIYSHGYHARGSGSAVTFLLHLIVAAGVWRLVGRLPTPVLVAVVCGALVLLLVRRRRVR